MDHIAAGGLPHGISPSVRVCSKINTLFIYRSFRTTFKFVYFDLSSIFDTLLKDSLKCGLLKKKIYVHIKMRV